MGTMYVGSIAEQLSFNAVRIDTAAHAGARGSGTGFFFAITTGSIPDRDRLDKIDALESVTFVGYPNGIWDKANLLPVARRGATASPLAIDFENTPCFLIDASVFGGSSGSPVFLLSLGIYSDKSGATTIGSRCLFLGVVAAVFFRNGHDLAKLRPEFPLKLSRWRNNTRRSTLGSFSKREPLSRPSRPI